MIIGFGGGGGGCEGVKGSLTPPQRGNSIGYSIVDRSVFSTYLATDHGQEYINTITTQLQKGRYSGLQL